MESPSTPKKIYKSSGDHAKNCRLCGTVGDAKFSKNLYNRGNVDLLSVAEDLYGKKLPNEDTLPRLICRPCERRLNNFKRFKAMISKSQTSFSRVKRCIPISPSVVHMRPSSKSSKTDSGKRTLNPARLFEDVENSSQQANQGSVATDNSPRGRDETFSSNNNEAQGQEPDQGENPFDKVLNEINNELKKIARRDFNSVLRRKQFQDLSKLNFQDIIDEIKTHCPFTYRVLSVIVDVEYNTEKKLIPLALIYSIIMFKRCHKLSRLQRVNTMLLAESDVNTDLYGRLQKYGICLEKTMKYTILDEIGSHFMDTVVEHVKAGKKFTFVLDNIDWTKKVHEMRSDNQNASIHAVSTTLVFDRVSSDHLPDNESQQTLSECDIVKTVAMTDDENAVTKERYKFLAARIMCEFLPAFSFLKNIANVPLLSTYKDEMKAKSVVVPFPVLMKDEKKYSEIIDVLTQLETWTHEIYSKAGCLSATSTATDIPPLPQGSLHGSSRPDQPLAHIRPVVDRTDPLATVKVPCYGDQLTRVRFAGAKDLRAGSHTARDRLDHLYPIRVADWHCKRSFLKLIYKKFYRNSGREKGTLRYFREKLQRRNVTLDVKHFEECEQLFISVGRAYTVVALLQFFDMETTEGNSMCNYPSCDVMNGDGDKQMYFNTVLDKFVQEYLIPTPENEPHPVAEEQSKDLVKEYSLCLLRYFFILLDIKEAVREGDGERLASLHKMLLTHFKSDSGYNVYAIEMLIAILQNEVFLTEAESHRIKWTSTANWKGGHVNNMEMDLLQENLNRHLKKGIKGMGANKTDKSIDRVSRAAGGLEEIVANFDEQAGIKTRSSSHSHKSSLNDEQQVINDLIQLKPFLDIEDRKHDCFPDASSNTLATLDWDAFHMWLKHHKTNLNFGAEEEENEEN